MTDATQKLIEAAQVALVSMGMFTPGQICDCVHHSPKNRHTLGDVCPVALQFVLDYDNLRAAIAAEEAEHPKKLPTQEEIDNGPHAGLGNIPSDYAPVSTKSSQESEIMAEIELIMSVLLGYPTSIARNDALRAMHRVSKMVSHG